MGVKQATRIQLPSIENEGELAYLEILDALPFMHNLDWPHQNVVTLIFKYVIGTKDIQISAGMTIPRLPKMLGQPKIYLGLFLPISKWSNLKEIQTSRVHYDHDTELEYMQLSPTLLKKHYESMDYLAHSDNSPGILRHYESYSDSQVDISMVKNLLHFSPSKHIEIHQHFVDGCGMKKRLGINKILSLKNISNAMTKKSFHHINFDHCSHKWARSLFQV